MLKCLSCIKLRPNNPKKPEMAFFCLQKTVKTEKSHGDASMLEKYKAAMVLSGAGDALGYYRSKWEMNLVGNDIQKKVVKMGGIKNITTSSWFLILKANKLR